MEFLSLSYDEASPLSGAPLWTGRHNSTWEKTQEHLSSVSEM